MAPSPGITRLERFIILKHRSNGAAPAQGRDRQDFYVLFTDEPPAPRATPNCSLAEGKVSARPPSRRTRVLAWKMKEQLESRCCLQAGPTAPERRVHQPRARISAHWGSPSHHCQCPGDLPQDPGPARPREEGRLSILYGEWGTPWGPPPLVHL